MYCKYDFSFNEFNEYEVGKSLVNEQSKFAEIKQLSQQTFSVQSL